jgi:hypothetical protein
MHLLVTLQLDNGHWLLQTWYAIHRSLFSPQHGVILSVTQMLIIENWTMVANNTRRVLPVFGGALPNWSWSQDIPVHQKMRKVSLKDFYTGVVTQDLHDALLSIKPCLANTLQTPKKLWIDTICTYSERSSIKHLRNRRFLMALASSGAFCMDQTHKCGPTQKLHSHLQNRITLNFRMNGITARATPTKSATTSGA